MNKRPLSVSVTFFFILLNALIWLAFGVIVAANAHPALPASPLYKGIMAFLAFITAGVLLVLYFLLSKRIRIAYYLGLALFAAISVMFFFDDVGLADLVVLAISFVPLILLVKDRAWYLHVKPGIAEN